MSISDGSQSWTETREPRVRAKKSLGQHFLVNRGVLERILAAAEIRPDDTIVEVGPGTGFLTQELVRAAGCLIAVELDRELAARLQSEFAGQPNVRIVQGDILRIPPQDLLRERTHGEYKVVANLPYYITSPVLRHFLASSCPPVRMVVMVQHEVAKTIAALPGDMSLLSVAVQFYGKPRMVAKVSPGSFRPPPEVHSAVLRIDTYPAPPVEVPSPEDFFAVVRAGFSVKRKQLRNAFVNAWHITPLEAERMLEAAGVDPTRRAQSLTLEEWARIARARSSLEPASR